MFPHTPSTSILGGSLVWCHLQQYQRVFHVHISKPEKEIIEQALHNFGSVDQDTLIDVLDSHECHQIPTEENISALVTQLGHKALIQTPMFVIDCWRPILKGLAAA